MTRPLQKTVITIVTTILLALVAPVLGGATAQAACAGPPNGPGEFAIQYSFSANGICGGTVLRKGYAALYGLEHIKVGGVNHEYTAYARARWQDALNRAPVKNPNPGYFIYQFRYSTPSGISRTMCVAVDTKMYDSVPHRGIVTAYYKNGWVNC